VFEPNLGLLFLLYINDIPRRIKTDSKSLLYADDTSVLITGNSLHDLQMKSVSVLNYMSKRFAMNGLLLNLDETKVMKFNINHLQDESFQFLYKDRYIKEVIIIKFLGVEIDKHMNLKTHSVYLIRKSTYIHTRVRARTHTHFTDP
jgi:hypothetical protein